MNWCRRWVCPSPFRRWRWPAGLLWRGALGGGELSASLLALIPAVLGMLLGQWLRQRISAVLFKRVFFIGLGALGAHLLISG